MQLPDDLTEREGRILTALVREFVADGGPVSSARLRRSGRFHVSSATIRSVFARLESRGYVHQPHTSAGRVPTDLGYRWYVDVLLQEPRPVRDVVQVEARLRGAGSTADVLENASHELSRASHNLGFALAPSGDGGSVLRHIEFVPLADARVLVIVVADGGQVSHKVIDAGEPVGADDLRRAASYLNTEFAGLPLPRVREAVIERLRQERTLYDALMARALHLARRSLASPEPHELLHIQGASWLLHDDATHADGLSLTTLRALFKMIEDKHRLVRLLTACIEGPGITIVIGAEHASPDLRPFSLVASTYSDGHATGTVGVIGPTRMRYQRAIASVNAMAAALSRLMETGARTDPR